jgi:predicted RNA-binding Zn ribbon-like protein
MSKTAPRPFDLDRRALCLDFLNTLPQRPLGRGERLLSYADLVRFALEAGAIDQRAAEQLGAEAARHPRLARRALQGALALREVLYRVLVGRGSGTLPAPADLEELNHALADALAHRQLTARGGELDWTWEAREMSLDRPLWPILESAAELLTSDRAGRVRECDSETCGWMFLDLSPAARRRWCDMKSCGNRAKARRHYQRQRQAAAR